MVVLGVALAPWCGSRVASCILDLGLRAGGSGSEFRLGIRSGVRFVLEGALGSVLPRLEGAGPWRYPSLPLVRYKILLF